MIYIHDPYRPPTYTFTCVRCGGRITTEVPGEQGRPCHWCRQIEAQQQAAATRVRSWGPRLPGKGDVVSTYQANGLRRATIEKIGPKFVHLTYVPKWNTRARIKARRAGAPIPEVKRNGFRMRLDGFTSAAALVETAEAIARRQAAAKAQQ